MNWSALERTQSLSGAGSPRAHCAASVGLRAAQAPAASTSASCRKGPEGDDAAHDAAKSGVIRDQRVNTAWAASNSTVPGSGAGRAVKMAPYRARGTLSAASSKSVRRRPGSAVALPAASIRSRISTAMGLIACGAAVSARAVGEKSSCDKITRKAAAWGIIPPGLALLEQRCGAFNR
jgi:hypothetical protein